MATKYQKFVKVVEEHRPLFSCIFCGQIWSPSVGNGRFLRGSYVCPDGCTSDYDKAFDRWNKLVFRKNIFTGKFEPVLKASDVEEPKTIREVAESTEQYKNIK